jgi:hypothetical protein
MASDDVATLRRAAAKVRETADIAAHNWPGRWKVDRSVVTDDSGFAVANADGLAADEHIALLDPTVALAVADWLDVHARDLASAGGKLSATDSPGDVEHALTVSRAILREPSP